MIFTADNITKHLYFTHDHEWIEFQDQHALIGVCEFKLKGIGNILRVSINTLPLNINRGQELGVIISEDYRIPFHMPIDGKLIDQNEYIFANPHLLTDPSLNNKWLFKIRPDGFPKHNDLITQDQYLKQVNSKII